MSFSHHSDAEQSELMQRFIGQMNRTAKREFPAGRMGAEDDGVLSYALANDDRHKTIILRFGKPVEWVAMGLKEAQELRDQLSERIAALRGVNANV